MQEGGHINRSLLSLGNCINVLHSNSVRGSQNFVPYRDSKLTRLLKDSLGGNCKTVMIANIAPCSLDFENTHNTLTYADRTKELKTFLSSNILDKRQSSEQVQIQSLKTQILQLKSQLIVKDT